MLKKLYPAMLLTLLIGTCAIVNAQGGANDQAIEMEEGNTDVAYPAKIERPRKNECGKGLMDLFFPDRVLVYNTPGWGRGNPDNIKFWSTQRNVRAVMNRVYKGKLYGWGLKSRTTRVCMGSAGRHLSLDDYKYIYLWRRILIAERP